jgi:hypothetical protein
MQVGDVHLFVFDGLSGREAGCAVTDGNVVTAWGPAALEFALHSFRLLEVYRPAVLEAWYKLFTTRRTEYFTALLDAAGGTSQ